FMQARYSEVNVGHFGLAADVYTHFTSPIRRYPDLVVHRLVKSLIETGSPGSHIEGQEAQLGETAKHASTRERIAEEAEREIEKIKKVQFMADKIAEEFEGIVVSVSRQGFFVELLEHYVEGFVPLEVLIDDHYAYSEKEHSLIGRRGRHRYRPGATIRVRVDRVDMENARIIFSIANNENRPRSKVQSPKSKNPSKV
ncbi:MAG: RNB domain-containing ribonuclease, partial [Acidobacteriota bacterium]